MYQSTTTYYFLSLSSFPFSHHPSTIFIYTMCFCQVPTCPIQPRYSIFINHSRPEDLARKQSRGPRRGKVVSDEYIVTDEGLSRIHFPRYVALLLGRSRVTAEATTTKTITEFNTSGLDWPLFQDDDFINTFPL